MHLISYIVRSQACFVFIRGICTRDICTHRQSFRKFKHIFRSLQDLVLVLSKKVTLREHNAQIVFSGETDLVTRACKGE